MEHASVLVAAIVFFGVGLVVGLYLRRLARAADVAAARQSAAEELTSARQQVAIREQQLEEIRRHAAALEDRATADQERIVGVTAEVARATAEAARAKEVERLLDGEVQRARQLERELRDANVRAAEAATKNERIPELEASLADAKAVLERANADADVARTRFSELSRQLAEAAAKLESGEQRISETAAELARLRGRVDELQREANALLEERTRLAADLDAERKATAERAAEAERTREQVRAEIEVLATRLLDEKGKVMLERSREGLEALLKPVADKLRDFEAKVEKTYDQENRDRASLLQSLKQMQDTQASLHKDAESLARALTGESKVQGDWGELVLERVLETAGLTEGREYELQVSHVDEDGGRKRPDALVYLPANRAIIVDAKCSLTAFVQAMRAMSEEERDAAVGQHLASVRAHVKELASKNYQDVLKQRTLDIVLMFVPNEAAFHLAISRDAALYEDAFRQRVVICSPWTLLAALQLISHVWRSEKQNTNAQKIAEEAGKLLEKLNAFVVDLDDVGMRLGQAQKSFESARGKLASQRGNVIRKATEIVTLGARVRPDKLQKLLELGQLDPDAEVPEELVALTETRRAGVSPRSGPSPT